MPPPSRLDRLPYPKRPQGWPGRSVEAALAALAVGVAAAMPERAGHVVGFMTLTILAPIILPASLRSIHRARQAGQSGYFLAALSAGYLAAWTITAATMAVGAIGRAG